MARMPSARSAPAAVAIAIGVAREVLSRRVSIVRPAPAASSRASAICSLVRGRLDSTSQPDGICLQPRRRRPSSVMNEVGARPVSPLGDPKSFRLSILWTFVTARTVTFGSPPVSCDRGGDELVGLEAPVDQEVRARIDRRGVDPEVPEDGGGRDVEAGLGDVAARRWPGRAEVRPPCPGFVVGVGDLPSEWFRVNELGCRR